MLINWVAALAPLKQAGWFWDDKGKFRLTRTGLSDETPWIHAPASIPGSRESGVDCGFLTIMHNYVFQQKAVHSFCMD